MSGREYVREHLAAYSVSTTLRPELVDMTVYTTSCSCGWLIQFEAGIHHGKPCPPPGWDGRAHALAHLHEAQLKMLNESSSATVKRGDQT